MRVCVGHQRGRPIFVGDAKPAVGDVEIDGLFLGDVLVGVFLQAGFAEHADQAFMQNVIAGGLWRAVTRDQRVRERARPGLRLCW